MMVYDAYFLNQLNILNILLIPIFDFMSQLPENTQYYLRDLRE